MVKTDNENQLPVQSTPSANWESHLPHDAALRRNLQGVLLVRLLLGIFFLVLTLLVRSHRAEELLSGQLQPLYTFSVILFLFTIVAALGLKRTSDLRRFAYLQLFFDVGAVTFLIYLSGGVESIFSFLYMPAIISGAVLLDRRGSMVSATASAISYGLLLDLQYFGWLTPLQLVGLPSQAYRCRRLFSRPPDEHHRFFSNRLSQRLSGTAIAKVESAGPYPAG